MAVEVSVVTGSDRAAGFQRTGADDKIGRFKSRIASFANGDARAAYNTLELAARSAIRQPDGSLSITAPLLEDVLQRKFLRYDKAGEEHFNLISALHKSVRNSDPDAALYSGDIASVLVTEEQIRCRTTQLAQPSSLTMT